MVSTILLVEVLFKYSNIVYSECRFSVVHQSIPPALRAPPPPFGLLRGICKFCTARGPGICHPRGHSRAFDTHAVSYRNITTQRGLLEKTQIGSSVKERNKLRRVVKACSRFYPCISSFLIKPNSPLAKLELSM